MPMTFSELYRHLRLALSDKCGEYADYEARELAEAVTNTAHDRFPFALTDRTPLAKEAEKRANALLSRRLAGEPLAYLLEYAYFYGRRFAVSPACLIPRADTEVVCEKMLSLLPDGGRLADIGTGSGILALTALCEKKRCTAVGYDISPAALAVARKNAHSLGVSERFTATEKNMQSEDFLAGETFSLIVSNPPYIPTAVVATLSEEVHNEPYIALDGGADGLLFYRRLLEACPSHIEKGGHLVLEIGYDEGEALRKLAAERGYACEIFRDFGGNDRGAVLHF